MIWLIWFDLLCLTPLSAGFSLATSLSGGRSRSTRREPPTMGKQWWDPNYSPFDNWFSNSNIQIKTPLSHPTTKMNDNIHMDSTTTIWFIVLNATFSRFFFGDQFKWWKEPEYPERTTDNGQATGKLYHLRLRVECTLFVIYKDGRETHAVLVIGLYELLSNPTTFSTITSRTSTHCRPSGQ
jgi:hypothetical protein